MSSLTKPQETKLLEALAKLGGGFADEDELTVEGSKLILPTTMSPEDAIKFLKRYIEAQNAQTEFVRTFKYRPGDGAAALHRTLKKLFGSAGIQLPTFTFFGAQPPQRLTINVGVNETIDVPWGQVEVPMLQGVMTLKAVVEDEEVGPVFQLRVLTLKKLGPAVQGLFKAVEDELESHSIYRHKAITAATDPEFLDLTGISEDKVAYSKETFESIQANLWTIIERTQHCREVGVPLKRTVTLYGPYGTGKSLTGGLTAKKAVDNDWTFIEVRVGRDDLKQALATAKMYQPAVVFFEDVDTVANVEAENSNAISRLLDAFDGVTTKGTEIICVLTTNHIDRIHKGMLRPGRMDAVIEIGHLDEFGFNKLITSSVAPENLDDRIDWAEVAQAMDRFLPAFVREAVDRAVRYALQRSDDANFVIGTEDLVVAAATLRPQLDLMEDASESENLPTIDRALRELGVKVEESVVHEVADREFAHLDATPARRSN